MTYALAGPYVSPRSMVGVIIMRSGLVACNLNHCLSRHSKIINLQIIAKINEASNFSWQGILVLQNSRSKFMLVRLI